MKKTAACKKEVNKRYRGRPRVQVYAQPGVSLTEQHHARSCDINTIMAKYLRTGVLDHIKQYEPTFGDISELDFKESMDTIRTIEAEFGDLPAYVRAHFKQDASAYLRQISTPEGVEAIRNLKPPAAAYKKDGSRDTDALRESRGTSEPAETDGDGVTEDS